MHVPPRCYLTRLSAQYFVPAYRWHTEGRKHRQCLAHQVEPLTLKGGSTTKVANASWEAPREMLKRGGRSFLTLWVVGFRRVCVCFPGVVCRVAALAPGILSCSVVGVAWPCRSGYCPLVSERGRRPKDRSSDRYLPHVLLGFSSRIRGPCRSGNEGCAPFS